MISTEPSDLIKHSQVPKIEAEKKEQYKIVDAMDSQTRESL